MNFQEILPGRGQKIVSQNAETHEDESRLNAFQNEEILDYGSLQNVSQNAEILVVEIPSSAFQSARNLGHILS